MSTARAADPADLWTALDTADDLAMATYVEAHYRDAGASLNDGLVWVFKPYDIIVNLYDNDQLEIVLGAMPEDAEVANYWVNWSAGLTGSRWDPAAFFADDAEARTLARYNQFVLAAHEYGHALTYRYDPRHVDRHDFAVNCRELYADRLATALVRELSAADPRFAVLESRYVALMASLNAQIAATDRYTIASLDQLETDCASIHVAQPSPQTMAPYASAFFERWRLLLATGGPPLAAIYAKHLFPHLTERQPPASGRAGRVEFMVELDRLITVPPSPGRFRQPLLTPSGLYLLDHNLWGEANVTVAYGPATGPLETIALATDSTLRISSAAALGPDRLLVLAMDRANDDHVIRMLDVQKINGAWRVTTIAPVPGSITDAVALQDPAGGVHLVTTSSDTENAFVAVHTKLDTETLAPVASDILRAYDMTMAVGPNGELYSTMGEAIFVTGPTGEQLLFAGNLLDGFKDDADPLKAEFHDVTAAISTPGGGLLVIDQNPRDGSLVLRRIAPAAQ